MTNPARRPQALIFDVNETPLDMAPIKRGAKWVGLSTAFIARAHQQKFPLAEPPAIDVADFSALATELGA